MKFDSNQTLQTFSNLQQITLFVLVQSATATNTKLNDLRDKCI